MPHAVHSTRADWLVASLLLALALIPVAAGIARLAALAAGGPLAAPEVRFLADPAAGVTHVVGAAVFAVAGAFQLSPGLRARRPGVHRAAGWAVLVAGLAAALSGLWLTGARPHGAADGALLEALRTVFGWAMVLCLLLGVAAIGRRDVRRHRAWMTRAYALGMGAGTQALLHLGWMLTDGLPDQHERALLMGAGWTINLVVAECALGTGPCEPRTRGGRRRRLGGARTVAGARARVPPGAEPLRPAGGRP